MGLRLEKLNLSSNQINEIPGEWTDNIQLHTLQLCGNRFTDINELAKLSALPALRNLYITHEDYPLIPLASQPAFLSFLLHLLPALTSIDGRPVSTHHTSSVIPAFMQRRAVLLHYLPSTVSIVSVQSPQLDHFRLQTYLSMRKQVCARALIESGYEVFHPYSLTSMALTHAHRTIKQAANTLHYQRPHMVNFD